MPRKKDPFVCPRCGARAQEPNKTWTLVSPMPDKYGRITVTVMGSFTCPSCGYSWRAVVQKIKTGGGEAEEERPREPGMVIEIDLNDLDDIE